MCVGLKVVCFFSAPPQICDLDEITNIITHNPSFFAMLVYPDKRASPPAKSKQNTRNDTLLKKVPGGEPRDPH